jgi:large subunit ribosomal protein L4e
MKTDVFNKEMKSLKQIELPKSFSVKVRPDILLKVYEAQKLAYSQPYGAQPGAGAQYSASGIFKHARHVWKTDYGKKMSRVPRKIMSRNGASFNTVGATVSSAVGGRSPNAPRAEKNRFSKINKKELLLAFESGLSGTFDSKCIISKYKKEIKSGFVFDESILKLKTKEFLALMKAAFGEQAPVLKIKKVRAGKGKLRGRKYKSNAGLLFVIASDEEMNRKGISVVKTNELRISDLSPSGVPGRLACYTEKAIKEIGERIR